MIRVDVSSSRFCFDTVAKVKLIFRFHHSCVIQESEVEIEFTRAKIKLSIAV